MRIAVVGCGAMGSIYAGLLADAGHEVLAVDLWADHVTAINRDGLTVDGASGHRIVRLQAFEKISAVESVDMIVFAVKSAAAGAAASASQGLVGAGTIVVTIQNGLGAAGDVAQILDPDRVVVGIAGGFGASLTAPGHVHHSGTQVIRLGAFAGLDFEKVETLVAVWQNAGFRAEAAADIAVMQWDKLICNVAYSAPCALTGLTVGEAMDHPDLGPISRAAATEAWEVARFKGIALDIDDPVEYVRAFAARMPNAKPSMLLDHEAGRRSEIDYVNGAIPREAAGAGRHAPVNETLTCLVRIKEFPFRDGLNNQTGKALIESFDQGQIFRATSGDYRGAYIVDDSKEVGALTWVTKGTGTWPSSVTPAPGPAPASEGIKLFA